MTTFRTGNHWGVTIVRQGERTAEGHIVGADELVAVVTNGDTALAERICRLLNSPVAVVEARRDPDMDAMIAMQEWDAHERAETTQVSASPAPPAAQQSPPSGDGGEEAARGRSGVRHSTLGDMLVNHASFVEGMTLVPELREALLSPTHLAFLRDELIAARRSSTESAVCFDPVSPEPVSPRPGPVPVPAGNKSTDGDGSLLRHLLIENGPYAPGYTEPFGYRNLTVDELNEFRNELLDLLILRSRIETIPARFTVVAAALSGAPADLHLNCRQCRRWALHVGEPLTLAELSQRAEKHAEECTP